jgi:SNF2 family DNA or RNA helicase
MSPEQLRMYKEMREDFVATINDDFCAADLAITKALRLQQIVSGHIPVENMDKNKRVERFEKNPRADALEELLLDLTPKHKIIVWAVFAEDYNVIEDVLNRNKIDFVSLTGKTKENDRQKFVDRFNTDPKCRVLYGHPDAGGIGVNLIASSVSIYYSRNFRLDFNLQSEARNFRGGSEIHEVITRIDIVCAGTIDELVLQALERKEKMGLNILRSMKGSI